MLSFMEKVFAGQGSVDMEEFLNSLDVEDETQYEDADAFVKPLVLGSKEDADTVVGELKEGNIILLNIEGLAKRNSLRLTELVKGLKTEVDSIDGDIARISHDRILLTPQRVKIIKRRIQE